jgi:hypothetical protein
MEDSYTVAGDITVICVGGINALVRFRLSARKSREKKKYTKMATQAFYD